MGDPQNTWCSPKGSTIYFGGEQVFAGYSTRTHVPLLEAATSLSYMAWQLGPGM